MGNRHCRKDVIMSRIPSFKDPEVWRKAMALMNRSYDLTNTYPPDERFGLISETRKTARSVPANIAEGKMRVTSKDFRRHVSIALGSLGELHTELLIAEERKYLAPGSIDAVEKEIEELGRMLRGLERALAIA
jgi:four helix bundle protein